MGAGSSAAKKAAQQAEEEAAAAATALEDTPFFRKYEMDMSEEGKLGEGSYAVVRRGIEKENPDVQWAIKCVDKKDLTEPDLAALQDEVEILGSINHPNVMRLHESFDEPMYFYLITELVNGGELFDRIVAKEAYNEADAAQLVKIFLQTLEYLHNNCVVHRDLKPENLLLKDEDNDHEIKLADFGYAVRIDSPDFEDLIDQCGTPGYVAPEIITHMPYGTKVDMWSAGVIIFILLGGYPPFACADQNALYEMIKTGNYEFEEDYWGHVSAEAKDLIASLLTVDPNKRLSATEALQHEWINTEGGVLEKQDLGKNLEKLKTFNAKRKMKATVKTIMLTNKMMGAFGGGGGGMLAKLKAQKAKEEAAAAEAAEIEASLPDHVDRELAKKITAEKYSEEKFVELANADGLIEKPVFMKIVRESLGVIEDTAEPPTEPAPPAASEAAAPAAEAADTGADA